MNMNTNVEKEMGNNEITLDIENIQFNSVLLTLR